MSPLGRESGVEDQISFSTSQQCGRIELSARERDIIVSTARFPAKYDHIVPSPSWRITHSTLRGEDPIALVCSFRVQMHSAQGSTNAHRFHGRGKVNSFALCLCVGTSPKRRWPTPMHAGKLLPGCLGKRRLISILISPPRNPLPRRRISPARSIHHGKTEGLRIHRKPYCH